MARASSTPLITVGAALSQNRKPSRFVVEQRLADHHAIDPPRIEHTLAARHRADELEASASPSEDVDVALCATGVPLPPGTVALLVQVGMAAAPAHDVARPQLVDVDEVAATLGLSKWTVYRWAEADRIPCIRAGRSIRFVLAEVMAALRVQSATPREKRLRGVASERSARGAGRREAQPAHATRAAFASDDASSANVNEQLRSIRSATRGLAG